MGLDQGLYIKKAGKGNNKMVDVAYFRKCNQLHGWIVRNIMDKFDNIEDLSEWNGKYVEITKEDRLLIFQTCYYNPPDTLLLIICKTV